MASALRGSAELASSSPRSASARPMAEDEWGEPARPSPILPVLPASIRNGATSPMHPQLLRRPATNEPQDGHKRKVAQPVSRTRKPAWNNMRNSDPIFGRSGLPSTYRPHPSATYGTFESGSGVPTSRPDSKVLGTSRPKRPARRQSSLDETELAKTSASTVSTWDRNTARRPALPYEVTWSEEPNDRSIRHVGVQSAATTWTRFFHGNPGQSADTGMRKSNPFYQHFDVYLDPDPLGPIHIAATGSTKSPEELEGGIKASRQEMDDFYRRSYERLYFLTGTEPGDLFVDTLDIGQDAKEGWPAMETNYEQERLNLVEYIRYVLRLHPRSLDDTKALMRLQNGLLRHVQQELMDHEREMAERVKNAMARLTGHKDDKLTALQLEILHLEDKVAEEQEGRRKADIRCRMQSARYDVVQLERNDLQRERDALQGQVEEMRHRAEELDAAIAEQQAKAELAEAEIKAMKEELRAERGAHACVAATLEAERMKAAKREKELLVALSSAMSAKVDVPPVQCYLPTLTEVHTTQLGAQMYTVALPPDARVFAPATCARVPGLRPGGEEKLARTLLDAPADNVTSFPLRSSNKVVTRVVPSGVILKFPRGPWEYGTGSAEYADTGAVSALPVGSLAALPVTLQASASAADVGTPLYRKRAVQIPSGSLVILPQDTHAGVDTYHVALPSACTTRVSQDQMAHDGLELGQEDATLTAAALAELYGVTASADAALPTFRLPFLPGAIIHIAGAPTVPVMLPEGSTLIVGPGEVNEVKEEKITVDENLIAEVEALRVENARLSDELYRLRVSNFPLELMRVRLRHVLTHLSDVTVEGMSALATGVLVELFREEPRRVSGQVVAAASAKDAPPGGILAFEDLAYSCAEAAGSVTVVLKRIGGSQGRVGAIVNTVDGTASAGADYKPVVDLEVIWEDGDTSDRAIPIKIYDDSFLEEDESFYVCITDVVPGLDAPFAIGLNDACEILIADDDTKRPPGEPMRWDDVTLGGAMPWEKQDCIRKLGLPGGFAQGDYQKWVDKMQSGAEINMERLRSLLKTVIQTKISGDALEDSRGRCRSSLADQFRSYLEYTYGTEVAAKKHSLVLANLRYAYRLTLDPFISLMVCMIGYFDACPPRVIDLVSRIFTLVSEGLMTCDFNSTKFWTRFSGRLRSTKMSPNEMRTLLAKLYEPNKLAKHMDFLLDEQSEAVKALQSALVAQAGEVDDSLPAEHVASLSEDQKPTISVTDFLLATLQHCIQVTATLRPVFFTLVRKYAAVDGGIQKLSWTSFCEVLRQVEPHASEERQMLFFRKALNMDTGPRRSKSQGNVRQKPRGRGRKANSPYKPFASPMPALASEAAEDAASVEQDEESATGVVVVGDGGDKDGETAAPRLPYLPWSRVAGMAAEVDTAANVLYAELDFVFMSSNGAGLPAATDRRAPAP